MAPKRRVQVEMGVAFTDGTWEGGFVVEVPRLSDDLMLKDRAEEAMMKQISAKSNVAAVFVMHIQE